MAPPPEVKVKICGQTSVDDCRMSLAAGADYLGVVFEVVSSPRSLDFERAAPIFDAFRARTFLLTLNRTADDTLVETIARLNPLALQLTGLEPPETVAQMKARTKAPVYKSIHLPPAGEGEEPDLDAMSAMLKRYGDAGVDGFVLDTAAKGLFGGTGVRSDWSVATILVARAPAPVFIAGGINPDNVADAASIPGVFGVDMASGVEVSKGKKSAEKLARLFVRLGRGG